MRYAILDAANRVVNIIVADQAFCEAHWPSRYVRLSDSQWCDLGATWDGKVFAPAA